jgi:hypothetical protein
MGRDTQRPFLDEQVYVCVWCLIDLGVLSNEGLCTVGVLLLLSLGLLWLGITTGFVLKLVTENFWFSFELLKGTASPDEICLKMVWSNSLGGDMRRWTLECF